MKIDYGTDRDIRPEDLFALAETVGWGVSHPINRNEQAVNGSIFIASARHEGRLVGLLRLVGDGAYSLHIADFIVHAEYQHKGIGTRLLEMSIAYAREHAIGIDDNSGDFTLFANVSLDRFYEKHGFLSVPNGMVLASSELRRVREKDFSRQWSEERDRSKKNP